MTTKPIKAVLFDCDGVLVDACELHREALNRALKQVCGYEIAQAEHVTTFNALTTKQKLDILVSRGDVPSNLTGKVWQLKQDMTHDVIMEHFVEEDAVKVAMHEWLKERGLLLACVTNSIRASTRLMLELTGQLRFMDALVTNQDVVNPKPHPEGYIRAMVRLRAEPDECLIVEDSEKGLLAAQATGAAVLQVRDGTHVHIEALRKALNGRMPPP